MIARKSELTGRTVHVWPVRTKATTADIARFRQLLSSDEIDRAGRFRIEYLQHAFTVAPGVLRVLLGDYLGVDPATVRFDYGARGKPSVAQDRHFQFNTSHSGDLAVFAFTLDCDIGIDVEQIRSLPDIKDVANRSFCVEEVSDLMSFPEEERQRAFFLCWTRKEAYVKALRDGLATSMKDFRLTLQPSEPARLIKFEYGANITKIWTLHDLQLPPTFVGALAYPGVPRRVLFSPIMSADALLSCKIGHPRP